MSALKMFILLALPLSLPACPAELADCSAVPGRITVTGSARLSAFPDRARLRYRLAAAGADRETARQSLEDLTAAFREELSRLSLTDEDLSASPLTLSPQYALSRGRRVLSGCRAERELTVSTADFALIAAIHEAAQKSGIAGEPDFSYELSAGGELRRQADELAMKDALDQASRLAAGFAVSLTKPCSVRFVEPASPAVPEKGAGEESFSPRELVVSSGVEAVFGVE